MMVSSVCEFVCVYVKNVFYFFQIGSLAITNIDEMPFICFKHKFTNSLKFE